MSLNFKTTCCVLYLPVVKPNHFLWMEMAPMKYESNLQDYNAKKEFKEKKKITLYF